MATVLAVVKWLGLPVLILFSFGCLVAAATIPAGVVRDFFGVIAWAIMGLGLALFGVVLLLERFFASPVAVISEVTGLLIGHPAAKPLSDLLGKLFAAIGNWQISAADAVEAFLPKLTEAANNLENATPDVLKTLRDEPTVTAASPIINVPAAPASSRVEQLREELTIAGLELEIAKQKANMAAYPVPASATGGPVA